MRGIRLHALAPEFERFAIHFSSTGNRSSASRVCDRTGLVAFAKTLALNARLLNLPSYQMLFPDAPFSHARVSGGRMWYNLNSSDFQGLAESRQQLAEWLKSLENSTGIPLSRTILMGFSQGGAMALDVGFRLPLAGLVCLSGYWHSLAKLAASKTFPPVLLLHGFRDNVVPVSAAHQARDSLMALGVPVKYLEFDIEDEIAERGFASNASFCIARYEIVDFGLPLPAWVRLRSITVE